MGCWGSQISRQSAQESGKAVSPTRRPPLPSRNYSWYSILLSQRHGHSAAGRIISMKNSSDIGNRTHDLSTCSASNCPTACPTNHSSDSEVISSNTSVDLCSVYQGSWPKSSSSRQHWSTTAVGTGATDVLSIQHQQFRNCRKRHKTEVQWLLFVCGFTYAGDETPPRTLCVLCNKLSPYQSGLLAKLRTLCDTNRPEYKDKDISFIGH